MVKGFVCLDRATVTILLEDLAGYDSPLNAMFGLSMLVEVYKGEMETQILYDANQASEPLLQNIQTLGISLDRLNSIFLSHGHFDHTGGLAGMLEAIDRPIPVVGHPSIFRPCFEIQPQGLWPIGLIGYSRADLEQRKALFTLTRDPLNLASGVVTTGEIPRINDFELPGEMYTIQDGAVVQDDLKDDASLILNLPDGLVILAGCCHAGIVNTIAHAKAITGISKIHAVIGGLHLVDASEDRLQKTVEALEGVEYVFAGHCTGLKALAALMRAKGSNFSQLHTGKIIHLPIHSP
jgi:7,8-dihydropterin-6-yl-methyl-4-(beta-D-ribofuranosyl)aminobenzene 5'-phosphate synthase